MNKQEEDTRDTALSCLYQSINAGEPPAALDAAILAQARSACTAPARQRTFWRRFSAPLALTATVLLAILVSISIERQVPLSLPASVPEEQPPAPVETRRATAPDHAVTADKKATAQESASRKRPARVIERKMEAAPLPAAAPSVPEPPVSIERQDRSKAALPSAAKPSLSPEEWLEHIRQLRRQGRMIESERALNEFRQTYPDYRLPEDLR